MLEGGEWERLKKSPSSTWEAKGEASTAKTRDKIGNDVENQYSLKMTRSLIKCIGDEGSQKMSKLVYSLMQ